MKMRFLWVRLVLVFCLIATACAADPAGKVIYVLPIRDEIKEPLAAQIRRGVKEAMDMKADALVLHMNTPGGEGEAMRAIMESVSKFTPRDQTYTLVDTWALSAGAFISAATRHIYMCPGSTIGAASPVAMVPGAAVPQELAPKFVSAYGAIIRSAAEVNGHNPQVFDAMVNKQKGLIIDGQEIVAKGDILTLTTKEAVRLVGNPPKPLLADGVVTDLNELTKKIGGDSVKIVTFQASGYEKIAEFVTKIAPILLTAGILLGYIEFKMQSFGLLGVLAIACFVILFLGENITGISGYEPIILFFIGIALIALEIYFVPGLLLPGLTGFAIVIGALLFSMIDRYPGESLVPTIGQLKMPIINIGLGMTAATIGIALLASVLPRRIHFSSLQMATVAGPAMVTNTSIPVGTTGAAVTPLRPAGTARFGERIADVVSEGMMIEKGSAIIVTRVEGMRVVVKPA